MARPSSLSDSLSASLLPAPRHRGVVLAAAAFYALHALIHVFDLAAGLLPAHHWLLDLPGVFLPAIALAVLSAPRWWPKET
ncbi:MAG TPA: hypothetical protein VJN89_02770 [Candidatus Acidoferrum sp.]|nr:hypothetical protein [Candidatus Acidoferrum sp.]